MFRITRIHHQGVMTCTLTEITCNGSQVFIMFVVGVWRHILNLWCVCVCAHTHTHAHTTGIFHHSLMMDPL